MNETLSKSFLTLVLSLSFFAADVLADPFAKIQSDVKKFTLSNGMRVVLFKRDVAPVFNGQIWVKVGGVNEQPHNSGIAHMLEHMAFKGSDVIGTEDFEVEKELLAELEVVMTAKELSKEKAAELQKKLAKIWKANEFGSLYKKVGATGLNAATSKDYTFYTVSLPSAYFEFWCWMESERFVKPVFRQFYKERDVVFEERRMRFDDSPGGKIFETLLATAYRSHPYRLPLIGHPDALGSLTATGTMEFFKTHYQPENMVISLVGDLEVGTVKPLLEKYFSRFKSSGKTIPAVLPHESKQEGERRAVVRYDAEPQLAIGYHKPTYPDVDDARFAVLHGVLSDGRSSMLYRELVQRRRIATSVYTTETPGDAYPSLFVIGATPQKGTSLPKLEAEIDKIVQKVGSKDYVVPHKSLVSAKRRVRAGLLSSLKSSHGMATILGRSELFWDDWGLIFKVLKTIEKTTQADLRMLVNKFLQKRNRTVVTLLAE